LVASPQYLAENAPISSPHDLASHPFIHEKGSISGGKLTLIDGDGQSDDYPITSRVITNQWHPVYEMLASGAGIGVLQAPACWPALRDGLLVPLLPNFNVPGLELNVLLPAGRPIPSRTRETIHLTKACLPEVWGFSPEP
jgi:DNA-binding transcriptional LysR family regulator